MNDEEIKKLQDRVRRWFTVRKYVSIADDGAQEYALGLLEGKHKHQTIDQFCIDYLRQRFGSSRTKSHGQRQNFEYADSFEPDLHTGANGSCDVRALENGRDADVHLRHFREVDRACFYLVHYWGLSEVEVGDIFGFSESRVSQRLKRIQSSLSARIAAKARSESERKKALEGILPEETKRQLWGMGEITFERMETGESWGVESIDETSF